ncbi:MAG TPA: CBS domain-containing protein [Blastocatellia bacterium]|nr:CBS domain-containing protein [Blastocatellia bacterium]
MSRSKEGRDEAPGMDEGNNEMGSQERSTGGFNTRVGAKGQTDYTPGRESSREYPRKSTSSRGRAESEQGSRSYNRSDFGYGSRDGQENVYRGEGRYGRTGGFGTRGTNREDQGDVYSRSFTDQATQRGQGSYGNRYGADLQREGWRERQARYGDREEYRPRENYQGRYSNESDRYGSSRANSDTGYASYERDNRGGRFGGYDREQEMNRSGFNRGPGRYSNESNYREEPARGYQSGGNLRCADIMTKDITSCTPQTSLREVAEKLDDENIGSLPVLENGRLIGIVTDRDIVCRVLAEGGDTRNATAADAMSQDLITITAEDSLYNAIEKMGEHQIRRLPVVDLNGRLRGMIALADIALEAEADRELAQAVERISQPTPNRARRV